MTSSPTTPSPATPSAAVILPPASTPSLQEKARALAQALGLALISPQDHVSDHVSSDAPHPHDEHELLLELTPRRLLLHWHEPHPSDAQSKPSTRNRHPDAGKPIFADWASLKTASAAGMSLRQPLIRALGLKALPTDTSPFRVLDTTAGWGEDAWLMASLGCHVTMLERVPLMAALLTDAMTYHRAASPRTVSRMTLIQANAIDYLTQPHAPFDVIHLDPMFPASSQKNVAAQNKPMRLLKRLAGDDADAAQLWHTAIAAGARRVIVKRPPHAPPIAGRPDAQIASKASRYDVYLTPAR